METRLKAFCLPLSRRYSSLPSLLCRHVVRGCRALATAPHRPFGGVSALSFAALIFHLPNSPSSPSTTVIFCLFLSVSPFYPPPLRSRPACSMVHRCTCASLTSPLLLLWLLFSLVLLDFTATRFSPLFLLLFAAVHFWSGPLDVCGREREGVGLSMAMKGGRERGSDFALVPPLLLRMPLAYSSSIFCWCPLRLVWFFCLGLVSP